MSDAVEVVIIGGGPAGLAAGIVLARAGVETRIYEQQRFPIDKACGEGLMPTGVRQLRQLGIDGLVPAAEAFPLAGIRFHTAGGNSAATCFAEGPGLGIRRVRLSAALLRAAEGINGLEIIQGTPATVQTITEQHMVIQAGDDVVQTRLLIGADGLNSRVRRWAGLQGTAGRWQRWGARRHFRLRPWSEMIDVFWSRQGLEAYVTPTGPAEVGIAFLWDKQRYRVSGGRELFPSLLAAFPDLEARLQGAPPLDRVAAVGPLQRRAEGVTGDGVLLLGDAAGYLDAITGEGLSLALAQALALQETVVPRLREQDGLLHRPALAAYERAYRATVRPYYRFTHLLLLFSRHWRLAEAAIQALRVRPERFQQLLSASMGHAPGWEAGIWLALLPAMISALWRGERRG